MRTWFRPLAGLSIGAATALAEVLFVLVRRPRSWGRRLVELERRRLARWLDADSSEAYDDRQAVRYLAVRSLVGLLTAAVLALLLYGLVSAGFAAERLLAGRLGPDDILALALIGGVLMYLEIQGLLGVAALDRQVALRYLGPSEGELLRRRIAELATSRAGVLEAVDAERRRIERDLHDGVQQRIVALSVLLGRTRRRAEADRDELLAQAHAEAQQILNDLRDVAWRVYPTVLDNLGLDEVLAGVADRAPVPVRLRYELPARPAPHLETAAYFVVSEAVTNAAKHSGADLVTVCVTRQENIIVVRITDNGSGGADPKGTGLSGLARRVAALDGRFTVDSPVGGPTVVTAELPCG